MTSHDSTPELDRPIDPAPEDLFLERMVYRCACGTSYQVDLEAGGVCPTCNRPVRAEALRHALLQTVTHGDLRHATVIHEEEQEDPWIGMSLGHFQLESLLGRGGMGSVYRALDTSLQRYVAVKLMRPVDDPDSVRPATEAMLREAVAQARLNHPNIITIYYVGHHQTFPFLAMELLSGPTLSDRLATGPLEFGEAIRMAIQVVEALQHAEHFGIVHADIKPSNLMLHGAQQVKLSDFGLARMAHLPMETEKISGTLSHMAPELTVGNTPTIQSDMYALGVTLFEMLFGRLPYKLEGGSIKQWLQRIQEAPIDFPSSWPAGIPEAMRGILSRLMAKQPSSRYADYEALRDDLQAIVPVKMTTAGFAPRAMAYLFDQAMLLTFFAPFVIGIVALRVLDESGRYSWGIPLLAVLALIIPIFYLSAIRNGWRSLGGYLFQLRTIDPHGLPLRPERRFFRELMRCALAWLLPLATLLGLFWTGVDHLIDAALLTFVIFDFSCFFITPERTTFHDLVCQARVVLDANRPHWSQSDRSTAGATVTGQSPLENPATDKQAA